MEDVLMKMEKFQARNLFIWKKYLIFSRNFNYT